VPLTSPAIYSSWGTRPRRVANASLQRCWKRGSGRRGAPAFNEWVQLCAARPRSRWDDCDPTLQRGRCGPRSVEHSMRWIHSCESRACAARIRRAMRRSRSDVRVRGMALPWSGVGPWTPMATAIFRERHRPFRFAQSDTPSPARRSVRARLKQHWREAAHSGGRVDASDDSASCWLRRPVEKDQRGVRPAVVA
jgi:hypothetical protein